MPRKYKLECTRCGTKPGTTDVEIRNNLYVKRIEFRNYGMGGRSIRARTIAWLCRRCMLADDDYQIPERSLSEQMVE